MKEITLKEIANTLGISITTVSKALKNYPDVSKKLKRQCLIWLKICIIPLIVLP